MTCWGTNLLLCLCCVDASQFQWPLWLDDPCIQFLRRGVLYLVAWWLWSDAGESPKRKQTTFWTRRKLEIKNTDLFSATRNSVTACCFESTSPYHVILTAFYVLVCCIAVASRTVNINHSKATDISCWFWLKYGKCRKISGQPSYM